MNVSRETQDARGGGINLTPTTATTAPKVAVKATRKATRTSPHISNFGSYSNHLTADQDGYVHTSIAAVMDGRWDGTIRRSHAAEIAASNRDAIEEATAAIAEWMTR